MALVRELLSSNKNLYRGKDQSQFAFDVDAFIKKLKSKAVIAEIDTESGFTLLHAIVLNNLYPYADCQEYDKHVGGKTLSAVAEDNDKKMIESIFKHFTQDDDALMRLLLTPDKNGNTALFAAYNRFGAHQRILNLLRGKLRDKLNPPNRDTVFLVRNGDGKTFMHAIASYWEGGPDQLFSTRANQIALCMADTYGNTPLHTVLLGKNTKDTNLNMLKSFCELAKSYPADEKEFSMEALFCQNNDHKNPLHLACQRPSGTSADEPALLEEMLKILPRELAFKKIMETDQDGMTPLQSALKSGQFDMANQLFDYLTKQKQMITSVNPKASLLHYACEFGNSELIQKAMDASSVMERYGIKEELPRLKKLMSANPHLQAKHESLSSDLTKLLGTSNRLFDCFHYLEKNSGASDFNLKLNDFCGVWKAIELKKAVPEPNPVFSQGVHAAAFFKGTEPYFEIRKKLQNGASDTEIEAFKTLIDQKSTSCDVNIQQIVQRLQLATNGPVHPYSMDEQPYLADKPYQRPVAVPVGPLRMSGGR